MPSSTVNHFNLDQNEAHDVILVNWNESKTNSSLFYRISVFLVSAAIHIPPTRLVRMYVHVRHWKLLKMWGMTNFITNYYASDDFNCHFKKSSILKPYKYKYINCIWYRYPEEVIKNVHDNIYLLTNDPYWVSFKKYECCVQSEIHANMSKNKKLNEKNLATFNVSLWLSPKFVDFLFFFNIFLLSLYPIF